LQPVVAQFVALPLVVPQFVALKSRSNHLLRAVPADWQRALRAHSLLRRQLLT
jgi:hypothetical protein